MVMPSWLLYALTKEKHMESTTSMAHQGQKRKQKKSDGTKRYSKRN